MKYESVELVLILTLGVFIKGQAKAWLQTINIYVNGILHKNTGVLKKNAIELAINE